MIRDDLSDVDTSAADIRANVADPRAPALWSEFYGLTPALEGVVREAFERQWGDRVFAASRSAETRQRCDCCGKRREFYLEDGYILCRICLGVRRHHLAAAISEYRDRVNRGARAWYRKRRFRATHGGAAFLPMSAWLRSRRPEERW
jgi:hypothetical protein